MQDTEDFLDDLEIEEIQVEEPASEALPKKTYGKIFLIPLVVLGVLLLLLILAFVVGKYYIDHVETESVDGEGQTVEGEVITDTALQEEIARLEALAVQERADGMQAGEDYILAVLRESLESGKSVVETLRSMYRNYLVLASGGKYHFVPIREDLKKNHYAQENLITSDNGDLQYWQNGQVVSYKGIDVSKFQGNIDWQKVAQDGVSFAIIRVGFRGYGANGTLMKDATAEANLKGANDAGIKTGVYFYTQAITKEEMLEEVQLILDMIEPYSIECPVVIDVEKVSDASGRMNKLDPETRTELVKVFCEAVKAAGYRPMIYHNLEMAALMLNIGELEEYEKWFAYYNGDLYYPYEYKLWQYSDKGHVNGIKTEVDMNIAFEPIWE